jgi:hypothetical protein
MTVSSSTARVSYSGNGSTQAFAVPFYFLSSSHLLVTLRSSTGVETPQVLGTDYTVTGAGVLTGGTVTMTTAPASGATLVIVRNVPLTQETDLQPNDRLPAETLEQTVDKLTMITQQLDEASDRAIKFPVSDSSSFDTTLPVSSTRAGKYFKFGSTGAISLDSVAPGYATAVVTDFGAVGDDSTVNTTAIQAAIDSLTNGGTLFFPTGTYRSGSLTIGSNNIKFLMTDGTVLKFPTLGASTKAITVNANNFSIEGGKLQGPAASVYVANENGIHMLGTSTSARKSGLRLVDVEITQFGGHGIYAQFVDDILLDSCKIHYCGYSGASFLSCNHGVATKNQFLNITPGTVGNMYGITLTHDSTGYSSDPNAGTKLAANPFCWDWYIGYNYAAYNAWEPIDCHGGYEITIDSNKVYASYGGIACCSSSGAAAGYAGANNVVTNNVVDARNPDGSASGYENDNYGINLNGGSTLNHKNVVCKGNVVIAHGILGNTNSGAIQAVYVQNASLTENIVQKWGGAAIVATASSSMVIDSNTFLELGGTAAGAENAIMIETTTSLGNTFTITNNNMQANGGTAGLVGVRAEQITTLPYFAGNDFAAATSSGYVVPNDFLTSDLASPIYRVTVNNAGGGAAVNVNIAALSRYQIVRIDVTSSNAASEISNFTNGVYGQILHIHSPSSTAFVLNATAKRLSGGTSFTASQYDIVTLLQTGDVSGVGGVFWTEISRSVNA